MMETTLKCDPIMYKVEMVIETYLDRDYNLFRRFFTIYLFYLFPAKDILTLLFNTVYIDL